MIEISQENKNIGEFLEFIKNIYKKPTPNIILNGERQKTFPARWGISQG